MSLDIAMLVVSGIGALASVIQAFRGRQQNGGTLSPEDIEAIYEESSSSSSSSSESSSSSSSSSESSSSSSESSESKPSTVSHSSSVSLAGSRGALSPVLARLIMVRQSAEEINEIIDADILDEMLNSIERSKGRLQMVLSDPNSSDEYEDEAIDIASANICAELMRIKRLNGGELPEHLVRWWESYECG